MENNNDQNSSSTAGNGSTDASNSAPQEMPEVPAQDQDLGTRSQSSQQPQVSPQTQQPAVQEVVEETAPDNRNSSGSKRSILVIVALLILVALSGGAYFYLANSMDSSSNETLQNEEPESTDQRSAANTGSCNTEYDENTSSISLPQNDRSVVLLSGSVDQEFTLEIEAYFLPEGEYEKSYSDSEEVQVQVIDKDNNILFTWNTSKDAFFTVIGEPGIREKMEKGVFAFDVPYSSSAKRLVWKVDGENIYDKNLQLFLIRQTLSRLSDEALLQKDIKEAINDSLQQVEECINEDNYLSASRILEFETLPLVEEGVSSEYKKTEILASEKVDLVNIIKDSIVRLDEKLATATLTPIPEKEGNIRIRRSLDPGISQSSIYLNPGEGIRYHDQNFQIEFVTYKKLNCSDNDRSNENIECVEIGPEKVVLLLTDRNTSENETVTLDTQETTSVTFKNFEVELSEIYDHLNSVVLMATNLEKSRFGL